MFIVANDNGTTTSNSGLFVTGSPGPGLVVVSVGPPGLEIQSYQLDGNGCTSAATTTSISQYQIIRGVYTTGNDANGGSTSVNSKSEGAGAVSCTSLGGTSFEIGGRTAGGQSSRIFKGDIAEVIAYRGTLTATQIQQVESYLALKYGISLNQTSATDYLASNGTSKIWDATASAGYTGDIAAIGRDDNAGVNQKQSTSLNNSFMTIGLGTVASDNASNTNTFGTDKQFFAWSHNSQAATFSTATTTQIPSQINARMTRVWRAEENNGDVGNLQVKIKISNDLVYPVGIKEQVFLLISNNATDFSSATVVAATSFTNGEATFDNVNIADGQFFTLGVFASGPGGVTDGLKFWTKSNVGVTGTTSVSQWNDVAGAGNHATQSTAANQPSLTNNSINFNPALTFDGTSDYLDLPQPFLGVPTGASNRTVLGVGKPSDISGARWMLSYGNSVASQANSLGNNAGAAVYSGYTDDISSAGIWTANTPNFIAGSYDGTDATLYHNSLQKSTGAKTWSTATIRGYIGAQLDATPTGFWAGDISEFAIYNKVLTGVEKQRVDSYMALKYGLLLDQSTAQDYLASDGTTKMWDAAASAGYVNHIAGIGRDDNSSLTQKQSKSNTTGAIVTIGLGSIAADNASNTNNFTSDKQFMVWSSNNLSADFSSTTTSNLPSGVTNLMARIWRVEENNGDVGNVQVVVDITGLNFTSTSASSYTLLISTNAADFSSATSVNATSLTGNQLTFDNVNLADNQFFSVALGSSSSASAGTIGSNQSVCSGTTPALLTSVTDATGSGAVTYQWQSSTDNTTWADIAGATSSTFQPPSLTTTTFYRRVSSSGAGTATTSSVQITVIPLPTVTISSNATNNSISAGQSVTFTSSVTNGNSTTYQWQINGTDVNGATGATFTTTTLSQGDVITVVISSCAAPVTSNSITITVITVTGLKVPTLFTPNGDGNNDVFYLLLDNTPTSIDFKVLNIQNQVVYETKDVTAATSSGWDGSFNGRIQPNGRYIWYVKYQTSTGESVTKKGYIVLAR